MLRLFPFSTFFLEHSFMVKSYRWGGVEMCRRLCGDVQAAMWWVAHVIIVSPPVPIGLGFGFGTALGLGLGLRGPDLGLGLDN